MGGEGSEVGSTKKGDQLMVLFWIKSVCLVGFILEIFCLAGLVFKF
jgi:hypothetical protein